jgi:hypothetical protein
MKTQFRRLIKENILYKKSSAIIIKVIDEFRIKMHLFDSENKLSSDNQDFWNGDYSNSGIAQGAHWKNNGVFEDNQVWFKIGKEHLDLILNYSSVLNIQFPVKQIIEWGCGGGANAVHFAPLTEKFTGIEITSESLIECNKQVLEAGFNNFHPILIDASTPESVLNEKINEADLFICTYVYELLPSPAYGLTVLNLANKLLKDNGIAFIQIRYNDGKKGIKPKRWGYKFHASSMTSYTLEEFWEYSKEFGFEPLCLYLQPTQPLVHEQCYAYFFLRKKH